MNSKSRPSDESAAESSGDDKDHKASKEPEATTLIPETLPEGERIEAENDLA